MRKLRTEPISEINNSLKEKTKSEIPKVLGIKSDIESFRKQLTDSEKQLYEEEKREFEKNHREDTEKNEEIEEEQETKTELQRLYEIMRAQPSTSIIIEKLRREPKVETKQQNFRKKYDVVVERDNQDISITLRRKCETCNDEKIEATKNIQIDER